MRFRKFRRKQERTKTIIFTGGLNSEVTNLELKEGELYKGKNYMEVDSPFHGYTSIQGYEVFDGKTAPSDVDVDIMFDGGIDENTIFLMEAPTGFVDISGAENIVENFGGEVNTVFQKFDGGSFNYGAGAFQKLTPTDSGAFSSSFSSAFDALVGNTGNYEGDFTIDLLIYPRARAEREYIAEKPGVWRLSIDTQGFIKYELSSTSSATYDYSIEQENRPIGQAQFIHVSITSRNKTLRMAIEGLPITDALGDIKETVYPQIFSSSAQTWLGRDYQGTSPFNGFLDEIRSSNISRWHEAFEVPTLRYSNEGYFQTNYYDVERENQRATITEVPGSGPVRGVHIYQGELYALRDNALGDGGALYRAKTVYELDGVTIDDSQSGWELIDATFNPGGRMDAENWRFSGSFADHQVMLIVDGASLPRIYDKFDETMYLYDNPESVGIPDRQDPPEYAHLVSVFDNRAVFGYRTKDIALSAKTDPRDFTLGFGDQLLIGDEITDFQELPGEALGIFCRNSIKVLQKLEVPTSTAASPDYTFKAESFSRESGAIAYTVDRVLAKLFYADDRGVVDFATTDKYGDFEGKAITKKLNNIYLYKKGQITCSLVEKQIGQYRLFFDDGTSIWWTFRSDGELKGGTFIEWPKPVLIACEGEDKTGALMKFFTSNDGYVYQMDKGTSFNGEEIETELYTSFFHYGSPRNWKTFRRMEFEISASRGTKFDVRPVFNYDSSSVPQTQWWNPETRGFSGIWGIDEWGQMIWGGAVIQSGIHYTRGIGRNMSIEMRTLSKYLEEHVIHNCIVDFQQEDQQQ